jgi:hypothetical protein
MLYLLGRTFVVGHSRTQRNSEGNFEKEILLQALPSIGNVSDDRFREPDDELPQLSVLAFKTGERLLQARFLGAIAPMFFTKVRFHFVAFQISVVKVLLRAK